MIIPLIVEGTKPTLLSALVCLIFGAFVYLLFILRIHAQLCDVEVLGKDVTITDARGVVHEKKTSRLTVHRHLFISIYYLKDTKDRKYWFATTIFPWDMWDMDDLVRKTIPRE